MSVRVTGSSTQILRNANSSEKTAHMLMRSRKLRVGFEAVAAAAADDNDDDVDDD